MPRPPQDAVVPPPEEAEEAAAEPTATTAAAAAAAAAGDEATLPIGAAEAEDEEGEEEEEEEEAAEAAKPTSAAAAASAAAADPVPDEGRIEPPPRAGAVGGLPTLLGAAGRFRPSPERFAGHLKKPPQPPPRPDEEEDEGDAEEARASYLEGPQPNPPDFGPNVFVLGLDDEDSGRLSEAVAAAFAANGGQDPPDNGEFSSSRFAFLFEPGTYTADVPVGFYTTVAGLGATPNEVVFSGIKGVHCPESNPDPQVGPRHTRWRSAERFCSSAVFPWGGGRGEGMLWAAAEGSALRAVHVMHELLLADKASGLRAGGGFAADCLCAGGVKAHGHQTFCARNMDIRRYWSARTWNQVFIGCGAVPLHERPGARATAPAANLVAAAAAAAEKPFVSQHGVGHGKFCLRVPAFRRSAVGRTWAFAAPCRERVVPFENVYVARPGVDSAASMNERLKSEWIGALVLTPGIYELEEPLVVARSDLVVLGLGFATLRPTTGAAALCIAGGASGVRIAGLLIEAGPVSSPSLIVWGAPGASSEGGLLQDVCCRVGGPEAFETAAETMVHVRGNGLVCENLFLWRADHTVSGPTPAFANPCKTALRVDGDDVAVYGLVAEHAMEDIVVWNGDRGTTLFAKVSLPFDATREYGERGFCGYRVADTVKSHLAIGVGVHHCFRDHFVEVPSGICCPESLRCAFLSPLSVSESVTGLGSVLSVINGHGEATGPCEEGVAYIHGSAPSAAPGAAPHLLDEARASSGSSTLLGSVGADLSTAEEEADADGGRGDEPVFAAAVDPLTPRVPPVVCWCM